MKRMIVAACAAFAFVGLVAAPADAAIRTFKGPVQGGGTVKLEVKFLHGDAKKVGFIKLNNIPVQCDQGNTKVDVTHNPPQPDIPVNQERRFHYDFSGFTASISGRISRNGNNAHGEFDYGPANPGGGFTNCETPGPRNWDASRV